MNYSKALREFLAGNFMYMYMICNKFQNKTGIINYLLHNFVHKFCHRRNMALIIKFFFFFALSCDAGGFTLIVKCHTDRTA